MPPRIAPQSLQTLLWVLSDTHSLPALRGPSHTQLLPWQTFPLGANSARNSICCVQNYGLFLAAASPRPRCKHRHPHRAERALLQRHGAWGYAGETDLSFLPFWGWNPPSAKQGKTKAFRGRLGGTPTFPSLVPPTEIQLALHHGEGLSASLPRSQSS